MGERELLELAAKAAGYPEHSGWLLYPEGSAPNAPRWNPLTDDGDALRLATKLHMTVRCYMGSTCAQIGVPGQKNAYEEVTDHGDPSAATRRAIVRAAAALGDSQ